MIDTTARRRAGHSITLPTRTADGAAPAADSARTWVLGVIAFVVFWSLTYLLRQPGVADVAGRPFSLLGDFALEGAMLALSWLSLLVCACLALLRGTLVLRTED